MNFILIGIEIGNQMFAVNVTADDVNQVMETAASMRTDSSTQTYEPLFLVNLSDGSCNRIVRDVTVDDVADPDAPYKWTLSDTAFRNDIGLWTDWSWFVVNGGTEE